MIICYIFEGLSSSEAGLIISSAMVLGTMLQWGGRQSGELENQMVSVERTLEYGQIASESDTESSNGKRQYNYVCFLYFEIELFSNVYL